VGGGGGSIKAHVKIRDCSPEGPSNYSGYTFHSLVPVRGRSFAEIVGSNPTGGMDVYLL